MIQAQAWAEAAMAVIEAYHTLDDIDQPCLYAEGQGNVLELWKHKAWIDCVQWHMEDEIRRTDLSGDDIVALKRRIDRSNQDRTDAVEQLDQWLQKEIQPQLAPQGARRTETLGWALDRLSILQLKRFHLRIEAARGAVDASRVGILDDQHQVLCQAIDDLVADLQSGQVAYLLYGQHKLYNDPKTNPALYKDA